jgi:hypothetical protein
MKNKQRLMITVCAVLAVLLGFAGCGSLSNQNPSNGRVPGGNGLTGITAARAILSHAPIGTAQLSWDPHQKILTVSMQAKGLAPNSTHPVHIHLGVCDAPGTMRYALPNLEANALGVATMPQTEIRNVAHLPTGGWLLNIHNGPTTSTMDQSVAIACGTITMKETGSTSGPLKQQVELQGTTAPNEAVSGSANFSLTPAGKISVTVQAHGLQPGTHHAIHIHAGSCNAQGKMLYALPDLVADARGDATSQTTLTVTSIPTASWYINIHYGQKILDQQGHSIQQAFNPVACGNVMVS